MFLKQRPQYSMTRFLFFRLLLFLAGIISQEDWSNSEENICEKFGIYVYEKEIDGRTKLARNLEGFSWYNALTKKRNCKPKHSQFKDEVVYKHKGNLYL